MNFNNLIYGNDLDSLAYSYLTGIPIVMNKLRYPLFFEHFKKEHDLSLLQITNETNKIKTPKDLIKFNDSKLNVFKKLLLFQYLLGKIKFHDLKYVRLENDNELNVLTERNSYSLFFNKLFIINDNALNGIDHDVEHVPATVIDKFHISKRLSFDYDLFEEDFNLYISHGKKTYATMESRIRKENINNIENSFIYNKHKIIKLFQKHGEDLSKEKNIIKSIDKTVYDNDILTYTETDSIKQIRFSLEDYLCKKQTVQWLDAYPSIVGSKFTSMSTQTS